MPSNHIHSIALVGASGNVGTAILTHLLTTTSKTFHITVLTRADSSATFPTHPSLTIKKGSYTDKEFLHSAFAGNDAAIFALGFMAMDQQPALIEAAAQAGVRWILPTEFSADGAAGEMMALPAYAGKVAARKQVEGLGVKWIAVVTNPWTELSLDYGMFGIRIGERKAVMYEDAGEFNTTSLQQVGRAVAALLSLPVEDSEKPRASLGNYANGFVYVSSFLATQKMMLEAAMRATGTSEAEWSVEKSSIWGEGGRIEQAEERMKQGDFMALGDKIYGYYMSKDKGGNYEAKAKEDREVLGLREESVDAIMKDVVAAAAASA